jgi:hypothetical protein
MRSIYRWRTALFAAVAVALAGSVLAAGPAQAAQPELAADEEFCVLVLPAQLMKCFATPEEADAFVGDVRVGPPKGQLAGPVAGPAGGAPAQVLTLIMRGYDLPLFLGSRLSIYGTGGPCSLSLANIDYTVPDLGTWNNRISSYTTHSICWPNGYDFTFFGGASRGYIGTTAVFAGGWDNDFSSMELS